VTGKGNFDQIEISHLGRLPHVPITFFVGVSVLEIVNTFELVSGVSIPVEIAPCRPGNLASSYASCCLAEKELNWKAQYDLNDRYV